MAKIRFDLLVLLFSVFFTQICLGVVFLAMPILAYEMEASPFLIGLIGASGGIAYAAMTRVFGSVSDRFSRKKLLFVAEIVQAFAMVLCLVSQDPYQLIFARFVLSVGAALFWPLSEAYIGDLAEENQLDRALMNFNVSWSLATIIGPQLGGFLIAWFFIRTPFIVALALFFFTAMLLLLKTDVSINRSHNESHPNNGRKLSQPVRGGTKAFTLVYVFLFGFNGAILTGLFPAYATKLGVSADLIGLMLLLSGLTQTLTFFLANRLQSKLGNGIMLLVSSFFIICSLIMIGLGSAMALFYLGFAIFGIGQGMAYSTAISLVLKGNDSRRGKAAGLFESTLGFGASIGPLLGGVFYQFGDVYPYFFGALVSLSITTSQLFTMLRHGRANQ